LTGSHRSASIVYPMLRIRAAQVDVLTEATFERSVAEHLRRFFPDRCAALGDSGLLGFVREGLAKARRIGFSQPAHAGQFVTLMLVLGRDFDVDPLHPWAGAILRDPALAHPGTRISALCNEASRRFDGGAP
jgi:hypothetical protein